MSERPPRVSIVMPTYNQAQYIGQAVATLLAQDFPDFELIIVNDGSRDGTRAFLDAQTDPRIRVVHQDNRGFCATVNVGMRLARGEFAGWVSSDNFHQPWFLSALVAALEAHPEAAMAYSPFYETDPDGRVVRLVAYNRLVPHDLAVGDNRGGCAAFLYRRACHDELGYYDESLTMAADTEMWGRILRRHPAVMVLEPTAFYRLHESMDSLTKATELDDEAKSLMVRGLQAALRGEFDIAAIYGIDPADRDRRFAALCNLAAKLRLAKCPKGLVTRFYEEALTLAPRHHVVGTLVALLDGMDRSRPDQLAVQVAELLRANGGLDADEAEELTATAIGLAEIMGRLGDGVPRPLVALDTPAFEAAFDRSLAVFSYFGAKGD